MQKMGGARLPSLCCWSAPCLHMHKVLQTHSYDMKSFFLQKNIN